MKYVVVILCICFFYTTALDAQKKSKITPKGKKAVAEQSKKGWVVIETSFGNITIALNDSAAPKHSQNFRKLAVDGFYEGTTFHRVIPGFMIQGGDPNSKTDDRNSHGMGGPAYKIDAEIGLSHDRGVIAAARQGDMVNPTRGSNGSQFYITVADAKFLDGQYSVFGKVVDGMTIADSIAAAKRDQRDNPLEKILIKKITVIE